MNILLMIAWNNEPPERLGILLTDGNLNIGFFLPIYTIVNSPKEKQQSHIC